jgi:hypothetical protein
MREVEIMDAIAVMTAVAADRHEMSFRLTGHPARSPVRLRAREALEA